MKHCITCNSLLKKKYWFFGKAVCKNKKCIRRLVYVHPRAPGKLAKELYHVEVDEETSNAYDAVETVTLCDLVKESDFKHTKTYAALKNNPKQAELFGITAKDEEEPDVCACFLKDCPDCRDAVKAQEEQLAKELADNMNDWRYEVVNKDTVLGYEEWLEHKKEQE